MHQKKNRLLICILFICCYANAQNFTIKAKLQPVTETGFYSIHISPQLSSYTTIDYSDLRIADDKDQFVPYIITSKKPAFVSLNYKKLPVVKNELTDSGRSVLIIENEKQSKISSLALLIRNAAVNRSASISGSDDSKQWFTISENINFENQTSNDTDKYVQTINFPTSSYRFFKIIIDNRNNNPLNIIEAGSYMNIDHKEQEDIVANPSPYFIEADSSDKNTYINVHQNAAYHIEKISLQIESPKFFERDLDIINKQGISGFKIKSNSNSGFNPTAFNDRDWNIKIYNGDNPPLKIKSITLQQQSQNIIAYLQAGKNYHLLMHDSAAIKPVYDLQQFADSIPSNPPQLKIISFETINPASGVSKNKMIISSTWIWVLIIAVLVVLGFVTYRLTKEMSKKEMNDMK